MTNPQATAQPPKTYEDGLREAAEIARFYNREAAKHGSDTAPTIITMTANAIAAAIEAKAGSRG